MIRTCTKLPVLILAILLPVLPGGVGEGVLCFGLDGHVAFEATGSECCEKATGDTASAKTASLRTAGSGFSGSCGPCLDIPVRRADPIITVASSAPAVSSPEAAIGLFGDCCDELGVPADSAIDLRPYRTPSPAGHLVALLSTVLQV